MLSSCVSPSVTLVDQMMWKMPVLLYECGSVWMIQYDIPEKFTTDVADCRTVERLHDKIMSTFTRELRAYVVSARAQNNKINYATIHRASLCQHSNFFQTSETSSE